ncbi:MAG: sensor histidine kinase, partial [Nostoc sp.]
MTVSFSLEKQKSTCDDSRALVTETFIALQAGQLTFHSPIYFVRIVYYDQLLKKLQETIAYADEQPRFSQQEIAYLRSEAWLTDFPNVWNVHEFKLIQFPESFSYICPIGYTNQKPEYIQVITHVPLS